MALQCQESGCNLCRDSRVIICAQAGVAKSVLMQLVCNDKRSRHGMGTIPVVKVFAASLNTWLDGHNRTEQEMD